MADLCEDGRRLEARISTISRGEIWLVVYASTDRAGTPTVANFHTLFCDRPFVDPMLKTLAIAASVNGCSGRLRAAPTGWLVAGCAGARVASCRR